MKIKRAILWEYFEYELDPNRSSHMSEIIAFAKAWAENMESFIDQGKTIPECAMESANVLDKSAGLFIVANTFGLHGVDGGVVGSMQRGQIFIDSALRILFESWQHGEDLIQWFGNAIGKPDLGKILFAERMSDEEIKLAIMAQKNPISAIVPKSNKRLKRAKISGAKRRRN